jgi:hypothetical protein
MIHPTFIKAYAVSVCLFSSVFFLLFFGVAALAMWYIANPPVTTLEAFTYEGTQQMGMVIGLKNENKHIFEPVDLEDFRQRPEYYYNIAKSDHAQVYPAMAIRMLGVAFILGVVLVMHWRLYRRMKGMGA